MVDPENVARIRAFLEQHRGTYDRNALRQQLLSDGHDPAAVDLALAQSYGYEAPPTPGAPVARGSNAAFPLTIVGTFLFNYVLLPVLVALLLQLGSGSDLTLLFGGVAPILLALVTEGIAAYALRHRNPSVARGLRWGIVISLFPIAALLVLFGVCVALFRFGG